jgi:hypothetical protein
MKIIPMKHMIKSLLVERNVESKNFSDEILYKVGMENVRNNIEFYFDKTYTCESVIKELFIRGIINYIETNKFPCLEK